MMSLSLGMEATMLRFMNIGHKPRPPPDWRHANILAGMRPHRLTGNEQEERCLDAMSHWRDPVERLRTRRRRHHTLVDDNPASG
jgi:hypothetical protein